MEKVAVRIYHSSHSESEREQTVSKLVTTSVFSFLYPPATSAIVVPVVCSQYFVYLYLYDVCMNARADLICGCNW
eukprot:m.135364 g.135364  ORF g.135364 m.135364 type:complete len:75 (+) comp13119_c0_seq2:58-282(+)